jgi:hypothetical protein
MKAVRSSLFIGMFFLLGTLSLFANSEQQLRQEFQTFINSGQEHQITSDVWKSAWTTYLASCSGGTCPCSIVIADGKHSEGQNDGRSVRMWIGTIGGGQKSELWSGWGSKLNKGFHERNPESGNDINYTAELPLCKRRVGGGEVRGDEVCVEYAAGDSCRPISQFRTYMASLGVPESAGYTSFYFSVPMHNETYKFHDFYGCQGPSCPRTLGCLGLEKKAMKDLCVNHLGSDGTNGFNVARPQDGGAWLYFHNTGRPPEASSDQEAAFQGFRRLKNTCQGVSRAQLETGTLLPGSAVASGGQNSYSGGGTGGGGMGPMSGFQPYGEGATESQNMMAEAGDTANLATLESCIESTAKACPRASSDMISRYCQDQRGVERCGCGFEEECNEGARREEEEDEDE